MKRRQGPTPPRTWQPLQRAELVRSEANQRISEQLGLGTPDAIWRNDRYVVCVEYHRSPEGEVYEGIVRELSIRRQDRKPVNDWRDALRIKNQLAGEDIEAVELYPAQARVVDTANQRYLWCFPPGTRPVWPDGKTPVGFPAGLRLDPGEAPHLGAVQRPFDPSDPPRDTWATALGLTAANQEEP